MSVTECTLATKPTRRSTCQQLLVYLMLSSQHLTSPASTCIVGLQSHAFFQQHLGCAARPAKPTAWLRHGLNDGTWRQTWFFLVIPLVVLCTDRACGLDFWFAVLRSEQKVTFLCGVVLSQGQQCHSTSSVCWGLSVSAVALDEQEEHHKAFVVKKNCCRKTVLAHRYSESPKSSQYFVRSQTSANSLFSKAVRVILFMLLSLTWVFSQATRMMSLFCLLSCAADTRHRMVRVRAYAFCWTLVPLVNRNGSRWDEEVWAGESSIVAVYVEVQGLCDFPGRPHFYVLWTTHSDTVELVKHSFNQHIHTHWVTPRSHTHTRRP